MRPPLVTGSGGNRPDSAAGAYGKSVVSRLKHATTVTPKLDAADDLTNLNNFVTLYGTPSISSGILGGQGVVRYKNQALSDHHRASAVVGSKQTGTTRLVICGDENLTRFYAVEIGVGLNSNLSIIKGTAATSVQEGNSLLSILFNLLLFVFSLFSQTTTKFDTTTVTLNVADKVGVEYDPDTSTIKTYINDVATACSLQVPRGEAPHGNGYRWAGIAQGIDGALVPGIKFTSFTLEDV